MKLIGLWWFCLSFSTIGGYFFMSYRVTAGASLTLVLLLVTARADDGLKSGPQVGDAVPSPFNPLNVTGKFAGKKQCLV
jgi:hypothetical protein